MGKLGKKARKFAKKNLQSVLKRQRKSKSMFKRKASSRDERDVAKEQGVDTKGLSNGRNLEGEDIEDISLDAIFSEDDSDAAGAASDSDGYLSEDSSCTYVFESESKNYVTDNSGDSALSEQNRKILVELAKKTRKVDKLKEKDPGFAKFLESHEKGLKPFRNRDTDSDEDETSNEGMQFVNEDSSKLNKGMLYTSSAFNSWCQLVTEQHSVSALTSLLNGYRAACHYGIGSTAVRDTDLCSRIQNSESFCKLLMFMLHEADNIFRSLLGIPSSSCKKEAILELKKSSIWKTLRPLIKSYLRSTLFLLNQVTDSEILAFTLNRLRASIMFFAAFPSLLRRLIKVAVHLWATGGGTLSSHSFLIIRDVASVFSSDCFHTCLIETYKAFIGYCKFVEPVLFIHIEFLRNSVAELCSLDVQKSSIKAMVSIQQLSKILLQGLRTKKEEALKKICSWQYTNCIDLWVTFISANISDFDLQPLLFMVIQVINGVVYLFPGPRYFPLRLKCIQWLNHLSSSSGVFIPVASFALDVLEYKIGKEGGKTDKSFNFSSSVKVPKFWLKSQNFQEGCVLSAIELLSGHFAHWSYHISFPELATIPLICLKKFLEKTTIESSRRVVKRFIDQVEQNIEFVRKKRDEVSFSPKDEQVATFLQLEKCSSNASFTQYYKSIMEKAASRNLVMNEKISFVEQKKSRRKRAQLPTDVLEKREVNLYLKGGEGNKGKKRKS